MPDVLKDVLNCASSDELTTYLNARQKHAGERKSP